VICALLATVVSLSAGAATPGTNAVSRITSRSADFDRNEGVIMFEGSVKVDYPGYVMHSDQLFVFLQNTNRLSRVVALGNVVITNEQRVGYCGRATYNRLENEVVMYPSKRGDMVKLADYGDKKSEVEGEKITFWLDIEHVEIVNSRITVQQGEGDKRRILP
jgi:lipopolysaccharide export system protein LptA